MFNYSTKIFNELSKEKFKWIVILFSVCILGLLVCYPVSILFWKSLVDKARNFTISNYVLVFTDPGLLSSLKNSMILGVSSALFCLFIGLPMAFAVGRTNMPFKKLVSAMVLVTFVIPSFIQAIAWILLLGPQAGIINVFLRDTLHIPLTLNIFSMPGLVFVVSLNFFPFVYYSALASLNNVDPAYEEASRVAGAKTWETVVKISLPLVSPAIITGLILSFLHAVAVFGAPVAIALPARFHVLTTKIYQLF
jgi:iron(III) transport system permease protein